MRHRIAVHRDGAGEGLQEACQGQQQGGLAGSVRAEHGQDLVAPYGEVDATAHGEVAVPDGEALAAEPGCAGCGRCGHERSEEHTSELQSLMRISYAVFCLKKKT